MFNNTHRHCQNDSNLPTKLRLFGYYKIINHIKIFVAFGHISILLVSLETHKPHVRNPHITTWLLSHLSNEVQFKSKLQYVIRYHAILTH